MLKNLTVDISELVGMHVGDGTLYKTGKSLVWEMRGSLEEKEYYTEHVAGLLERITNIQFIPKFRSGGKQGCFGIQTTNKDLISLFVELGFKAGKKSHTIRIPDYIKNSTHNIRSAFIRGYFDTDGCLRFEKKNRDTKHKYPRIEFSTASKSLCDDTFFLLKDMGFRVHKWGKTEFKVSLAGKDNLDKFIKDIAPKNKKHLNKHLRWKQQGFLEPQMPRSHTQRLSVGREPRQQDTHAVVA